MCLWNVIIVMMKIFVFPIEDFFLLLFVQGAATTPLGKSVVAPGMMYFADIEAAVSTRRKDEKTKREREREEIERYREKKQRENMRMRADALVFRRYGERIFVFGVLVMVFAGRCKSDCGSFVVDEKLRCGANEAVAESSEVNRS